MYLKTLNVSRVQLRSKLVDYLAGLRQIRHENINPFVGCYMTPYSFSLMFEYCPRRSLQVQFKAFSSKKINKQDVINTRRIKFDWQFKQSLLTDLIRVRLK